MTYLLHFPYGSDLPLCVVNNREQAEKLAELINRARQGTDAPVCEVQEIAVVDPRLS
jgi:hypothetical protein